MMSFSASNSKKDAMNETNHYRYSYESGKLHDLTSSTIERQLKKALTTHLSTTQPQDSAPSEHAELLIWDEAPEAFYPQTPAFQKHFGRVLYVIPLSNLLKES